MDFQLEGQALAPHIHQWALDAHDPSLDRVWWVLRAVAQHCEHHFYQAV